ncbi:hypothetical protein FHV99_004707 [Ochrobactrum sp. P20RRXII]|nr:ribbon-helix-helix protein, CopG family [Ochrobactrum sp. P20RRXII]NIH77455.1 hypothetical protein [Ochrobactrum sp. P20RRXII]
MSTATPWREYKRKYRVRAEQNNLVQLSFWVDADTKEKLDEVRRARNLSGRGEALKSLIEELTATETEKKTA